MNFHLSNEQNLALRNSLATAEDFDMLDTLDMFDDDDVRLGHSADSEWFECEPGPFARAANVFGALP